MAWPRVLVLLYGLFNIVLGIQSYFFPSSGKASLVSLIAAGGMGLAVVYFFTLIPKNPRVGYIGTTVLALASAGRFAQKAFGGESYPGMTVFAVSLFVAVALTLAHFMAKAKSASTAAQG